mmetsp:Transcript_38496/g.67577  ORF Transcript_38496/g.67577 Transcript_38496/m.67577 type:complete len:211 (-) Transcript_38496:1548-2180(-)
MKKTKVVILHAKSDKSTMMMMMTSMKILIKRMMIMIMTTTKAATIFASSLQRDNQLSRRKHSSSSPNHPPQPPATPPTPLHHCKLHGYTTPTQRKHQPLPPPHPLATRLFRKKISAPGPILSIPVFVVAWDDFFFHKKMSRARTKMTAAAVIPTIRPVLSVSSDIDNFEFERVAGHESDGTIPPLSQQALSSYLFPSMSVLSHKLFGKSL